MLPLACWGDQWYGNTVGYHTAQQHQDPGILHSVAEEIRRQGLKERTIKNICKKYYLGIVLVVCAFHQKHFLQGVTIKMVFYMQTSSTLTRSATFASIWVTCVQSQMLNG